MPRYATDLPVRSDVAVLAPRTEEEAHTQDLLNTGARADTWRIIELFSRSRMPFEAQVHWSAGTGTGSHARISVAHATRLCVFARTLRIGVTNLGNGQNKVGVTVADGHSPSVNQYAVCGLTRQDVTQIEIPPFAARCRVDVSDWWRLRRVDIRLRDGLGRIVSRWAGTRQPDAGIPLGGAGSLEFVSPPALFYRVVFFLTL